MPNSPVGMAGGFAELRAQLLSRTGVAGPARRRALARLTDGWLGELAQEAGVNVGGVALVAVGGYGRGELSPFSDLDLVLLHSTETPASYAGMLAERLWYPIWDSKIRLDHSVRSVGGARQIARTDLPAMLGMLDLRHIAGDPELAVTLHRRVLADWRADAKNRLTALRDSCLERAKRSGELAFATTPDLKESRGGLRDLVVMRAVAASWVADCPHQGLEEARSALLDVRDVVQTMANRSTDRLQVQDQDVVAAALGLDDRDVLLRHVAGIARTVDHASDLTWHRVDRALSRPTGAITDVGGRLVRRTDRTPLADGIVEQEGEAMLARAVNPATDPTLIIRAAAAAAQAGLPVSPATVLRLARTCPPLPDPWPAPALDAFLALLGAGQPMIAAWEDLDQAGLIADLLPGWERLRSMPQRDPIHLFTVDRHLMETAVVASTLVRKVARPDLLLLTAILHDVGKGHLADYPNHATAGADLCRPILARMGVAAADVEVISGLILHHLLLAEVASKRDPDDPATVAVIADAVGDVATLDLLWALTEADARAAGPAAWTTWRAGQINHLAAKVRRALAGEQPAQPPAITEVERELIDKGGVGIVIEQIPGSLRVTIAAPDRPGLLAASAAVLTMHRLTVRTAAVRTIGDTGLQAWTVAPQFGDAPAAATLRADLIRALDGSLDVAARLARRSTPSRREPAAPPQVLVADGASDSSSVIEVRAHDTPGLLYSVSSALTTLGVSVVSARVHTLGADAVDVFYLRAADGSPLSPARAREIASGVAQALA
jgi:[protein-PII] uridylyltransferase